MKRRSSLSWRHQLEILFDGFTDCNFFETKAEIRESARRKIYEIEFREGFKIGQRQAEERTLPKLQAHRIVLPPEVVKEIFSDTND